MPGGQIKEVTGTVRLFCGCVHGPAHSEYETAGEHSHMLGLRMPVDRKAVSVGKLQAHSVIACPCWISVNHRELCPGIEPLGLEVSPLDCGVHRRGHRGIHVEGDSVPRCLRRD